MAKGSPVQMSAPISISGGAIYPYTPELMEVGARVSRFGDPYNLFRVVGSGSAARIWVPRNMAPTCFDWVKDERSEGLDCSFTSKFVPRNSEQSRVANESEALLRKGMNFITECPPGFGKTAVAMEVACRMGKKVLVVVTKEDIRDQWMDACKKFTTLDLKKDVGLIQGDLFQVSGRKVVIAMVQTLAQESKHSMAIMAEFGLVIFDEVHRMAADFFSNACFRSPSLLRWGLSATPDRKDGREYVLEAHIGKVLVRSLAAPMTPRVVVRQSPWKCPVAPVKQPDGSVKVEPIPHNAGRCGHVINMLCNHYARNRLIATFIHAAYKKGRCILVQSDRKEHLEVLASMVQSMGVHSAHTGLYVGGLTKAKREEAKQKKIIYSTFQMTAEATDIPWVDTLVLGTPKSDIRQIIGRCTREYPGKFEPLIFDLIDDSSPVFKAYWGARKKIYASLNAVITTPAQTPN